MMAGRWLGREFIRHQRAVMGLLADEFQRGVGGGPAVKFGRIQNAPFPKPVDLAMFRFIPLGRFPGPADVQPLFPDEEPGCDAACL